ncbi:MAG: class I SAM-dependent methyltransferase [Terracidiphilus sp.]
MSPAPDFNRLAGPYHWLEYATFGPWLSLARSVFLPQVTTCRRGLVFGDGDGRFAARLLRANPHIHIHAVDASPAMLGALVRRAGLDVARVRTELADARAWQPDLPNGSDQAYDAIFTHFFLDCLTTEEIQSLAATVRSAASPSAVWIVSDFAIPPGWYGSLVARPLIWILYRAFGWLTGLAVRTLPDHHSALRAASFILRDRRTWLGGLLISELWSALQTNQP